MAPDRVIKTLSILPEAVQVPQKPLRYKEKTPLFEYGIASSKPFTASLGPMRYNVLARDVYMYTHSEDNYYKIGYKVYFDGTNTKRLSSARAVTTFEPRRHDVDVKLIMLSMACQYGSLNFSITPPT